MQSKWRAELCDAICCAPINRAIPAHLVHHGKANLLGVEHTHDAPDYFPHNPIFGRTTRRVLAADPSIRLARSESHRGLAKRVSHGSSKTKSNFLAAAVGMCSARKTCKGGLAG